MCLSPIRILNPVTHEYMYMPCGRCKECVEKMRNSWAKRIEDSLNTNCKEPNRKFFLTLTYDNENLPLSTCEAVFDNGLGSTTTPYTTRVYNPFLKGITDPNAKVGYTYEKRSRVRYNAVSPDGVHGFLCRKDLQDFFKRLRKVFDKYYHCHLSYFACGEYGGDEWNVNTGTYGTSRPHYHALIWLSDVTEPQLLDGYELVKYDKRSFFQKRVPRVTAITFKQICYRCWKKCSSRAFTCEPIRNSQATARYVTKYILKANLQAKKRNDYCLQRVPMFRAFSQHIGIEGALKYLDQLQNDLQNGIVQLPVFHRVCLVDGQMVERQFPLPSYYTRYAFKQIGKNFDPHKDARVYDVAETAWNGMKELWKCFIDDMPVKDIAEIHEKRAKCDKDDTDICIYDSPFSVPDKDHKKEREDLLRKSFNQAKSVCESTDYLEFVYDNPWCLDAQIEDEKRFIKELNDNSLPFTISCEDVPF